MNTVGARGNVEDVRIKGESQRIASAVAPKCVVSNVISILLVAA